MFAFSSGEGGVPQGTPDKEKNATSQYHLLSSSTILQSKMVPLPLKGKAYTASTQAQKGHRMENGIPKIYKRILAVCLCLLAAVYLGYHIF